MYEDATDGLTNGWIITDNDPSGATVTNEFDTLLGSNVISLNGTGGAIDNTFLIGGLRDAAAWNNTSEFTVAFRLRSEVRYIINLRLQTNRGVRYVRYKNTDVSGTRIGNTVDIGLGSHTIDNTWYEFRRDLQQDLNTGDPGTIITAVNGMLIRGLLRIDDIALSNTGSTPDSEPDVPETPEVPDVPPSETPLVADAGPDLTIRSNRDQVLSSTSTAGTGRVIASYEWRENGVVIANGENPTLSPPLAIGAHTIELTVTDDLGATASDTVSVVIIPANGAPVANAGVDVTFEYGEPQILDGSNSTDDDGTIVSYDWKKTGSVIASGVTPTLTPALPAGTHIIDLTVTDDEGATDVDTVIIEVEAPDAVLVANAGGDIVFDSDDPQVLNGSASNSEGGSISAYEWRESGNLIATGLNPTLSPSLPEGVYIIELTVIDDDGATATDTITVTVSAPETEPDPQPDPQPDVEPPTVPTDDNFDPANSANRFVDVNRGQDGNNGSLSNPWKTIKHGISRLSAGQTLVIREGTYYEQNLSYNMNGSASRITTIRNYPGERVVVDASDPRFRASGSVWELYDRATSTYRTKASNYGNDIYTGTAISKSGAKVTLVPYHQDSGKRAAGLADLTSTTYGVSNNPRYVGPGVFTSSGRVYIRLSHVPSSVTHGISTASATDTNPDDYELRLSSDDQVLSIKGSYLVVSGLTLTGSKSGIQIPGSGHHIDIVNTTFSVPAIAILMRDGVNDVLVDGITVNGDFPEWLAWTDMKGGDGQSTPASHWPMRTSGISGNFVENVTIRNSQFNRIFDGMVISGSNVEVSGNKGEFLDDFIQLGSDSDNVNIFGNTIEGAGPSHYGRGDSSRPGTIYIHGNFIDSSKKYLEGKHDPSGILRASYTGWQSRSPFPTHRSAGLENGDPWKIYHNTIVFDGTTLSKGTGIQLWTNLNKTGAPHEVYNNLLVEVGGGSILKDISISGGAQVYDGNIYWQTSSNPSQPMFADFRDGSNRNLDFDSVAQFRASSMFQQSKAKYSPGWMNSGFSGDPLLDSSYRPIQGGRAASGAVPLPSSFPGRSHSYRGALAPR